MKTPFAKTPSAPTVSVSVPVLPPVRKYRYCQDKPDSRDHVLTLTSVVTLPPAIDLRPGPPPAFLYTGTQLRDDVKAAANASSPPSAYTRVPQSTYYLRYCLAILKRSIVFGFQVYAQFESKEMDKSGSSGSAPVLKVPDASVDKHLGGEVALAVGYDDAERMYLCSNGQKEFKMPYSYFLNPGLCSDFWTILSNTPK